MGFCVRVAVFNALIGLAGGGERVAVGFARAFEELGYGVTLFTFGDRFRGVDEAFRLLGGYRPGDVVVLEPPFSVRVLGVGGRFVRFRKLMLFRRFLSLVKGMGFDLVVDTSSNAPTAVDISYIHYPAVFGRSPGDEGRGPHWRVYNWLVERSVRGVVGGTRLVLANSYWTLGLFRRVWGDGYRSYVLHPPVDVEFFGCGGYKEDLVVTVSRFTPEKRIEDLVYAAKELEGYRFVFAGSTHAYSDSVIRAIRERAERLGAKNIEILVNLSREDLRDLLCRARYYVHPPYPEHFGISVVEAMAAGCIPIVYRDGGAWTDVVSMVSGRLGYLDVTQIPRIVRGIDSNPALYKELSAISRGVSRGFSYTAFKERLSVLLRKNNLVA